MHRKRQCGNLKNLIKKLNSHTGTGLTAEVLWLRPKVWSDLQGGWVTVDCRCPRIQVWERGGAVAGGQWVSWGRSGAQGQEGSRNRHSL